MIICGTAAQNIRCERKARICSDFSSKCADLRWFSSVLIFPDFCYASVGSLSLQLTFLGCFFDIGSAISWCSTTIKQYYSGGNEAKMVGRNTRRKRDNKKTLKTILSAALSHLTIFLSVKIRIKIKKLIKKS